MPKHSRDDFMNRLSLQEIEQLTGLPAPEQPDPEAERAYRERAWDNVKVDVASKHSVAPIDGEVGEPE
jgi:hypothetical protein